MTFPKSSEYVESQNLIKKATIGMEIDSNPNNDNHSNSNKNSAPSNNETKHKTSKFKPKKIGFFTSLFGHKKKPVTTQSFDSKQEQKQDNKDEFIQKIPEQVPFETFKQEAKQPTNTYINNYNNIEIYSPNINTIAFLNRQNNFEFIDQFHKFSSTPVEVQSQRVTPSTEKNLQFENNSKRHSSEANIDIDRRYSPNGAFEGDSGITYEDEDIIDSGTNRTLIDRKYMSLHLIG